MAFCCNADISFCCCHPHRYCCSHQDCHHGAKWYCFQCRPVALAAIVCAYTWLLGLASNTQFKYAVFLTLVTANAVILCQYSPRPGSHGRPHYFYARCTTIAVSIVLVWLIGLILPWWVISQPCCNWQPLFSVVDADWQPLPIATDADIRHCSWSC